MFSKTIFFLFQIVFMLFKSLRQNKKLLFMFLISPCCSLGLEKNNVEHKIDLTGNNNDLLLYNELGSRHGKNGSHTLNQTEDEQNLGSPRSKLLKILDSHDLSRTRIDNGISSPIQVKFPFQHSLTLFPRSRCHFLFFMAWFLL